jgi:ribosomal protein L25 (general stress protein Ctc)
MFIYTSTFHHYLTPTINTVHGNVFLWLYLYSWKNWRIKTNNKETRQIFEKKCGHNEAVFRLILDFSKAYDPVWKEILYNTLSEFVIHMELVRLIKMCLTEI